MNRLFILPVLFLILLVGCSGGTYDFENPDDFYRGDLNALISKAEQGNSESQFKLGRLYDMGKRFPENDFTASKWYTLAAEQGYADAQYSLGWMYDEGEGVPEDDKTAVKWYRLAAEQGHASAQNNLGVFYEGGVGVPENKLTAIKWYTLASEQGLALSQYNLGSLYYNREGVPIDLKTAHKWLTLSEKHGGDEQTKRLRIAVEIKMSQTQFEESLREVEVWEPKSPKEIQIVEQPPSTPSPPKQTEIVERRETPPEKVQETEPPTTSGSGSGFFVSKLGHIITNEHVVRGCGSVTVGDNSKTQVTVSVLETDRRNDLALLKISSMQMASAETKSLIRKLGITVVPLASDGLLRSEDVELGESVLVAGYPYGDIFSNTIKVTGGMVSANRGFGDDTGQFQMDAAVQPGNSGGPIYDENGNIVGVVIAQLNKLKVAKAIGSLPENVNFGIKASNVRQFLTSSGLPTKWSKRSKRMSTKQLAKIAKNQTVMVVCHP